MASSHKSIIGTVSLAFLGLLGCSKNDAKHHADDTEHLPRLNVVTPTQVSALPRWIELSATVEALEKVDLCARVPGYVAGLHTDIDIGHRFKVGEELVKLAVPDLEAQKSHKEALLFQARKVKVQVAEAKNVAIKEQVEAEKQEKRYGSEYAFRQLEFKRLDELVKRGAQQPERLEESQRQLDAADAAWMAAKAAIETKKAKILAAQADLEVAQSKIDVAQAEVKSLDVMLAYATIKAPFDGFITKRWVDNGAVIKDPSAPILTVMRADFVRVLVDVPERDVPYITANKDRDNAEAKGNQVKLTISALPKRVFAGTVTRMSTALDPQTRTMRVEVHLPNPDEGDRPGSLRPNMFGTAEVLLEERLDVLTVPATALARRDNKTVVFHVANPTGDPPRGKVHQIEVEIGIDTGRFVEIRKGLIGNELIIAKGNGVLRVGDEVIAVEHRP